MALVIFSPSSDSDVLGAGVGKPGGSREAKECQRNRPRRIPVIPDEPFRAALVCVRRVRECVLGIHVAASSEDGMCV